MSAARVHTVAILVLSVAVAVATPLSAQQAGTYHLRLCANSCSATDSTDVAAVGTVVLFEDAPSTDEMALLESIRLRRTERPLNACFSLSRRSKTVRDEELYLGIIPVAATRWDAATGEGGGIMAVYASPDAFYELRWVRTESGLIGEGWSRGWRIDVDWHRNAFFEAERVGPPDINACKS